MSFIYKKQQRNRYYKECGQGYISQSGYMIFKHYRRKTRIRNPPNSHGQRKNSEIGVLFLLIGKSLYWTTRLASGFLYTKKRMDFWFPCAAFTRIFGFVGSNGIWVGFLPFGIYKTIFKNFAPNMRKTPINRSFSQGIFFVTLLWCRWPDSNRHGIATGGFWVHYVCQFHHTGKYLTLLLYNILLIKSRLFLTVCFLCPSGR